tara:strand:+ start:1410 stop:1898 length:489 start_codon:yes stop_codon:yes gene_type:complete
METILYLQIDGNKELKLKYDEYIKKHNTMVEFSKTPDSGFDVFHSIEHNQSLIGKLHKLDFKIKCAMIIKGKPSGFYMYPRSSLSKTPLRLANSVGIIDSGYRGNLMGFFDLLNDKYIISKHQRLVQLCAPNLQPFRVFLINDINCLGITERNTGGFGSTGI